MSLSPQIPQMIDHLNSQLLERMDNPVFSPFSILYAMILVYLGSDGQTRKEMQKTLNISINDAQLILNLGRLRQMFNSNPEDSIQIVNSNAVILKSGFTIDKIYQQILLQVAKAQLITFNQINEALIETNQWVADQTFNLIPKLLQPSDLSPLTRFVLVNVIYFHAEWQSPFQKNRTYKDQFYTLTGTKSLDFMHQTHFFPYFEDDQMQYLQLPYRNDSEENYSFQIALPKNGKQGHWGIPPDLNWHSENVELSLPQFEHRYKLDLAKIFQQLGIKQLFTSNANLQLISKDEQLSVGQIIHEAVVKVNEKGTKAAAATAVVMKSMAMRPPENKIIMNVNHRFYYSIVKRYQNQDVILFNGIFDG